MPLSRRLLGRPLLAASITALAAALVAGCSGSDASGSGSSAPVGTAANNGVDPTDDSGGSPPRTDAGSVATEGGKVGARDYGADLCGNGIDDDGNGRIDDACPVTACSMKLSEAIDTGHTGGVAFVRGADEFLAFGGVENTPSASLRRFVSGVANGPSVTLELPRAQLELMAGKPLLLAFYPSSVFGAHAVEPATLASSGAWSLFSPTAAPVPAWSATEFDMLRYRAVNGSVWAVAHLKNQPKLRVARLDASLALLATYDIDLVGRPTRYEIVSLGGMPFVYDHTETVGTVASYQAVTRVVALGDSAPRFNTQTFIDSWPGDVLSWGGSGHLTVAQALDKVLLCRGGPREHLSHLSYAHTVDCHVASASSGATLANFTINDYALGDVASEIHAAPNGADFLLARAKTPAFNVTELHIDRLTAAGVLTKDIVVPVSIPSTFIDDIIETAPNQYAVVYRTDTNPGEVFVRTLGCSP